MSDDGWSITCKCGHTAPVEEFQRSPSGIDLLDGQYQCHACGVAWEIRKVGKPKVYPSGFVIPAKRACVEIDATL